MPSPGSSPSDGDNVTPIRGGHEDLERRVREAMRSVMDDDEIQPVARVVSASNVVVGRCGHCDRVIDRLPCPFCGPPPSTAADR